jgi:hypothetical protein
MFAMDEPLKEEFETYARHEEELKKSATGKYVVIKDSEIVGFRSI